MRPLYHGQENHYKKMLDLQERLRRSEEERIRLEEKFSLLVQESRNRHQSCINQLRIRYVEFLEEQRARNERNDKLLGTLDKVDSSLALMTAKTERLNILRKQYEAYLLRAYGTQRTNESVAADSGLESQNDREISPTPVFSKSVALRRQDSIFYASPEFPPPSRKTANLELPDAYKLSAIQKSADIQRDLNDKFAQAAAVPSFYDEVKDVLKSRTYIPSYRSSSTKAPEPDRFEIGTRNLYAFDPLKCTGSPNMVSESESAKVDSGGLRNFSARPATTSTPGKYDLDRYLSKIKQAQADALEAEAEPEADRSLEDAEQEQNTSGDLLNVTLSDDGNPLAAVRSSPSEEDAAPAKDSRSRFRALLMRQAYAAENGSRNRPIDRTRRSPISKQREGGDDAEEALPIDKFRQSEIASPPREIGKPFSRRPPPLSVDDAFAKLALLSEPRRPNNPQKAVEETCEARVPAETIEDADDSDHQESRNDDGDPEEGDGINGDGIEDDYDDTVDIDSWMPDDAEQQLEEVQAQDDDIRDIPRRKLESIEEVEPLDDEEDPVDDAKPADEEIAISDVVCSTPNESPVNRQPDSPNEIASTENAKDAARESNEEPSHEKTGETYEANEEYVNQQYYPQDGGTEQLQYQEGAENYEQQQQQQGDEQHHYQYSEDPNQQYAYDANADYTGYDGQQYTEAEYEEYMKQYQQYDPNQTYEHDPNQLQYQQQYDANQVYADYSQEPQAYGEGYSQDVNQAYDYSADQQQQAYAEAYAAQQSSELYGAAGEDEAQELTGQQSGQSNVAASESSAVDQSAAHAASPASKDKPTSKDQPTSKDKPTTEMKKKKKDVIKSILDSDSESFIERNLSNSESDFDFN